ncbi:MAG: RNA polymerase sigma-32 factor [Hyphomicrobiaceae bacterium]|jgi:RNA polymerase sigma-32 factor
MADKTKNPRRRSASSKGARVDDDILTPEAEAEVEVEFDVEFDVEPEPEPSDSAGADDEIIEVEVEASEPGDVDDDLAPEGEPTKVDASSVVPALTASTSLVPSDALSRYLAEIRQYPVLDREAEHVIAVRYAEDGDSEAAVKLVTANLRLVVMVAREYQRAFHNLLDLIQEGNVGLLEAVKQFDPYRGVRFPSYAVWWVRAYIIRYVMNNFRMVKVGTTQAQRRLFFNLQKERARLEAEGFAPTVSLIAENLGVKEREVIEMDLRMATSAEVSGNAPLGNEEGAASVMDLISDDADTEGDVAQGEFYALMHEKLEEFAETLEGREAEIFRERLIAEEPMTLQQLGDRYGVSRERVRQMEAAMKKRLREYLVAEVRDLEDDIVL